MFKIPIVQTINLSNLDLMLPFLCLRLVPFKYTWEGGMPLISYPPPTNRKEKKFHPPPPEFTSINIPLPPEKNINFLYRNTQS